MNKKHPFVAKLLAVAAVAAVMGSAIGAFASDQQYFKIIRVRESAPGSVQMSTDGVNWTPVRLGDLLPAGTTVRTAKGASVDGILGGGDAIPPKIAVSGNVSWGPPEQQQANIVRVFENSTLTISVLNAQDSGTGEHTTDTEFDLKQGHMMGSVKHLSKGSHYEVKIPNGVAGVRGTIFDISSSGILTVLQGTVYLEVVVPNPNNPNAPPTYRTVEVSQGTSYNIPTGMVVQIPNGDPLYEQVVQLGSTTVTSYVQTGADTTVVYLSQVNPKSNSTPAPPPPESEMHLH
jgi:hypothetical protein